MLLDLARHTDEPELRRLLRDNPMAGAVRISLEREPDFFQAAALGARSHEVIVAREQHAGRVVVMGQCSVLNAYVDGRATRVGYMHQLRADHEYPGYALGIIRVHQKLWDLCVHDGPSLYFASIVADNLPARRFLEAPIKGMPHYRPLEPFVTLALPVHRRFNGSAPRLAVESGAIETLDETVDCLQRNARRYQLTPVWTHDDLLSRERTRGLEPSDFFLARREGRVIGCLAVWDQRAFKQSVVRGYGRWLGRVRLLVNPLAPWLGTPRLPAPGQTLQSAFVSHLAVDDDDPEVARALLAAAYRSASERGLDLLLIGLAGRHPLLHVIREEYPCRNYTSLIYQVCWPKSPATARTLDDRCPHPEAAIL